MRAIRAVLLGASLLVACGDVVKKTDGGPDDGGGSNSDGSTVDSPPPAPITIHVRTSGGVPDLAANVLVMTDTGDIVYDALVDATGSVTVEMPARGWVTSRSVTTRGNTRLAEMITVRGVEPGDEIFLGPPKRPEDAQVVSANRAYSFTRYNTAATHTFYVPCGNRFQSASEPTNGTVPIKDECVPPTFSLLALASVNGTPQAFSYVPNQTRGQTSTIVVPTPWTNLGNVSASFTNVPTGMEYFAVTRYTLLDGVATWDTAAGTTPAATVNLSVPYAPGVGTGARFTVTFGNQTTGERQFLALRTAAVTPTIAFDYSMLDLPRLLSIPALTTSGATWTETAGTFNADLRTVRWTGHFGAGVNGMDVTWTIVDNERGGTLTLPTLPDSYAAYDPRKLSNYRDAGDTQVHYTDCDMITGYKAARSLNIALQNTTLDFKATLGDNYRCRTSESPYNDAIP